MLCGGISSGQARHGGDHSPVCSGASYAEMGMVTTSSPLHSSSNHVFSSSVAGFLEQCAALRHWERPVQD